MHCGGSLDSGTARVHSAGLGSEFDRYSLLLFVAPVQRFLLFRLTAIQTFLLDLHGLHAGRGGGRGFGPFHDPSPAAIAG